jgi:hypothetical protein
MKKRSAGLALTHSSWINAWSLRGACAALGVDLRVPRGPRELPLPQIEADQKPDWQLFTEEASLREALAGRLPGRYWPERFPLELLDDKWAFAAWLSEHPEGPRGLPQWPLDAAPGSWTFPVLLKARHSWWGARKLPRGWVCRDAAALHAAKDRLDREGWPREAFFLQRWVGDAPMRLLAVCGFFDATDERRNLHCVTERVADYGQGPSSSAMLVTLQGEQRLVEQAQGVLRRLRYCGPYELEFVVARDGEWLLELNPRFWMQHGLFAAAGNGLVRRYLQLDAGPESGSPLPPMLWVDGIWLLRRLLRLDLEALAALWHWRVRRAHRLVICPTLAAALQAALWRAAGRRIA